MKDSKFTQATKAWLKTHDLTIQSCDSNISFYKKQINQLNKKIAAEKNEKKLNIELRDDVVKNLKKEESKE